MERKTILLVESKNALGVKVKKEIERDYCALSASCYSEVRAQVIRCLEDAAIVEYILPDCDGIDILVALSVCN